MPDDVNGSESSTEQKAAKDESLKASEAEDRKDSEGDESGGSKAQSRIRQLIEERDEARRFAVEFRKHALDPQERTEWENYKKAKLESAKQAEEAGDISPDRLAEIRRVMRKADPEYKQLLERAKQDEERRKQDEEVRDEAKWDEAEEIVRDCASDELGLKGKTDEAEIAWIGQQVMLAIHNDEKLSRKWQAGNLSCIRQAFKVVIEHTDKHSKSIAKLRQTAQDKRRVTKLPTLPGASGSLTSPPQDKRLKGLQGEAAKQAGDDAWAILQQHMTE
jgi:hypothetical protein